MYDLTLTSRRRRCKWTLLRVADRYMSNFGVSAKLGDVMLRWAENFVSKSSMKEFNIKI